MIEKKLGPIPLDSPPPGGMIPVQGLAPPDIPEPQLQTPGEPIPEDYPDNMPAAQYFYHLVVQITVPGSIKTVSLRMTLNATIRNETYESVRQVLAEKFMHPIESIIILSWQEMQA